jgi:hypothetical protein
MLLGYGTHYYGGGSVAWTLSATEQQQGVLIANSAGGAADIIAPALMREYTIINVSGAAITIKAPGKVGIVVANNNSAKALYATNDYIRTASSSFLY